MRKIILVTALLVVFALVVAPALAAKPQDQHTVKWRGTGIDETGARVQLSGSVVGSEDSSWHGKATYVDRDRDEVLDIRLDNGYVDLVDGFAYLTGHTDVTIGGITYQRCDVELGLDEATSTYSMYIWPWDGDEWNWYRGFAGDQFKGTIRFT